ncbi:MAG: acylphosphatase [Alphaproteobacteria bacterium]
MADAAVRLRIRGRVQGVWFRAWTVQTASAAGLRGWVRNRADGSVETLLIGPAPAVEAVVARCHDGPPRAQVAMVERSADVDDGSAGFSQRPTA